MQNEWDLPKHCCKLGSSKEGVKWSATYTIDPNEVNWPFDKDFEID